MEARWRAVSRSALLGTSMLLTAACGDEGDGPDMKEEGSPSAVVDGATATAAPNDADVSSTGVDAASGGSGSAGNGSQDAGAQPGRDAGGGRDAGPRDAGSVTASDAAAPLGDGGPDMYAELRQICVDTINMHRATLNLAPLARASTMQESCSDEGARTDGMMNAAHYSARNRSAACKSAGLGAQNTCPNWKFGPRTGNATLADALKRCLQQMWNEGMPPIPVADCIKDQAQGGCFLTHGHWINMTSTSAKVASCGFADLGNSTFWMNQDFASR